MSSNFFATCFRSLLLSRILSLSLPPLISPRQFPPFISSHSRLPSIGFSTFRLLLIAVGSTPLTSVGGRAISSSTSPHTTTLFAIFFTAEWIFAIRKSGFLSDSHFAFHSPYIKVSSRSSVSSIVMSHLIFARISLPSSLFLRLFYYCCVFAHILGRQQFADRISLHNVRVIHIFL